jgi:hypothetical protein
VHLEGSCSLDGLFYQLHAPQQRTPHTLQLVSFPASCPASHPALQLDGWDLLEDRAGRLHLG